MVVPDKKNLPKKNYSMDKTETKDNLIMKIIEESGLKISRPAAMIMLEDGMLTEELPIEEYILVYNLDKSISSNDVTKINDGIWEHPDWATKVKEKYLKYIDEVEKFADNYENKGLEQG